MRKKPTDYKLRAFVLLMFIALSLFIGFAYVLYHKQANVKAYFDSVQFIQPKRLIRIHGKDDVEILRVNLGKVLQQLVVTLNTFKEKLFFIMDRLENYWTDFDEASKKI